MISKHIKSTISELKTESHNIRSSDADSVDTINQLIDKLERQLSEPEITDHRSLIDQLQQTINEFEVSHPTITSIANNLMVKLAGIGV